MGRPKQFLPLAEKTVVEWALKAFLDTPDIERIILVMTSENIKEYGARLLSDRVKLVEGGATRMESVRKGFKEILEDIEIVAVHDGARPLITPSIVRDVLEEAYESGAAVAAVPVKDTLKKVTNKQLWVSGTPMRSSFWLAQTPQCYRREILEEALQKFPDENAATDESQLVEKSGHRVKVVAASYENIKITTPEDLIMAESILETRFGEKMRASVGFGYDIHKLVEGRALWLAGVKIEHSKGLLGHSDGDAILHAVGDAILGALGEGEIGMRFPPENPKIKGIQSHEIIAIVMEQVLKKGARVSNVDVTILAEEPKLKSHYPAFKSSLATLLGLKESSVNIKAKSHEGLDSIGQGLAIACYAVAMISLPKEAQQNSVNIQ
jgi:2-C-methyl-D-erythritol 4-phosphate cytidylyltransferase/2-C-methyl-D-erythritol 2,4-cyclodiphosphate synthase